MAPPPNRTPAPGSLTERILLLPKPLVLTGLPYKCDPTVRQVTRRARLGRERWITVTYLATHPDFSLPFGADRALLAWITTQAFATGQVHFSAIADYFRAFGLDTGGRAYTIFRQRYQRIANLAIRIEQLDPDQRTTQRLFVIPTSQEPLELLTGSTRNLERKLLRYHRYGFTLDNNLWRYLRENPVPAPLAVLRAFHNSPRGWDLAQLVLYRSFVAKRPTVIPWDALLEQLGGKRGRDPYRLKYQLQSDLKKLRGLLAETPAEFLAGGRGLRILLRRGGRR